VTIKPYKVDLSQFSERVRDEMKFTIHNISEEDLDISLVSWANNFFVVDMPEKVEAGKTAEAIVTLTDEAIEQSFEKSLTIELSDKTKSRFTIPVKRTIRTRPASEPTTSTGQRKTGN
jgi:hypothetical protein